MRYADVVDASTIGLIIYTCIVVVVVSVLVCLECRG